MSVKMGLIKNIKQHKYTKEQPWLRVWPRVTREIREAKNSDKNVLDQE